MRAERERVVARAREVRAAAAPESERIRIEARNENACPVEGAVVYLAESAERTVRDASRVRGTTGADGVLELDAVSLAVAPGQSLLVHHRDYQVGAITDPRFGMAYTITLRRGHEARFRCATLSGVPVARALVILSLTDVHWMAPWETGNGSTLGLPGASESIPIFQATSNESGEAIVTGLAPGRYRLRVGHPFMIPQSLDSGASVEIPVDPPTEIAFLDAVGVAIRKPAHGLSTWRCRVSGGAVWHGPHADRVEFWRGVVRERVQRTFPDAIVEILAARGQDRDANVEAPAAELTLYTQDGRRVRRRVSFEPLEGLCEREIDVGAGDGEFVGSGVLRIEVLGPDSAPVPFRKIAVEGGPRDDPRLFFLVPPDGRLRVPAGAYQVVATVGPWAAHVAPLGPITVSDGEVRDVAIRLTRRLVSCRFQRHPRLPEGTCLVLDLESVVDGMTVRAGVVIDEACPDMAEAWLPAATVWTGTARAPGHPLYAIRIDVPAGGGPMDLLVPAE